MEVTNDIAPHMTVNFLTCWLPFETREIDELPVEIVLARHLDMIAFSLFVLHVPNVDLANISHFSIAGGSTDGSLQAYEFLLDRPRMDWLVPSRSKSWKQDLLDGLRLRNFDTSRLRRKSSYLDGKLHIFPMTFTGTIAKTISDISF